MSFVACSSCFKDQGLKLDALKLGVDIDSVCPNCGKHDGRKLDVDAVNELTVSFFVYGSVFKSTYGAANVLQINEHHYGKREVAFPEWLKEDLELVEDILKMGVFYYAPRLYRLGEIEPLLNLQEVTTRKPVVEEIVSIFPKRVIPTETKFYRLRLNPEHPVDSDQYEGSPDAFLGRGRLDSPGFPVLYGSQDLDICIHECRVTVEDNLYVATMSTTQPFNVLDLTGEIKETGDGFTSLRLTVHMLFRAPKHSYEIIREIALEAARQGLDGVIYPSYFSQVHSEGSVIENIGLFGRLVKEGKVKVECVNRLLLNKVVYDYRFGPGDF